MQKILLLCHFIYIIIILIIIIYITKYCQCKCKEKFTDHGFSDCPDPNSDSIKCILKRAKDQNFDLSEIVNYVTDNRKK